MSSTAPSVNMNMAGMNMNMPGMNMNMNMSAMSGIGAACGMSNNEPSKPCGVQFPLHAQRRKRRVLFTQAQVSHRLVWKNFRIVEWTMSSSYITSAAAAKINIDGT